MRGSIYRAFGRAVGTRTHSVTASHSSSDRLVFLAGLGKAPSYLAKSHELIRRQNLPNREFTFKPQAGKLGLGGLKLAKTLGEIRVRYRVAVDRHVELAIRLAHSTLGIHHCGPTLLVHATDLLHLFRRQTELRKQVRAAIPGRTVVHRFVGRWTVLTKRGRRTDEERSGYDK